MLVLSHSTRNSERLIPCLSALPEAPTQCAALELKPSNLEMIALCAKAKPARFEMAPFEDRPNFKRNLLDFLEPNTNLKSLIYTVAQ
jgi:hypothetical protein